ncbi:MAG: methyltransferase domain-containing protein [Candidatus Cloacimonetes bacterium]|nr:methyltransferase domain-containing protein [Candidatus Cloacimonadota bacterium]
MDKIAERLKRIKTGKILDVATGGGQFVNLLMNSLGKYDKIIGIDTNKKAAQAFETNFKDKPVEFQNKDAYKIDFDDESFDMVSISNSLHHFEDIDKILSEMKRVLKKDGYFIISEMHCEKGQTETQKTHILLHHWWASVDSRLGIYHEETLKKEAIKQLIEELDLKEREFFDYTHQIEDPKDPKLTEYLLNSIDPYVNRISEHKDFEMLKQTGNELKERLKNIGYSSASLVFVIGKK